MIRLGKWILWGALAFIALLLIGLLSLNLYLRSPGIRDRVEATFQGRLGQEVRYESVSYLPWRGLKVRGFEVPHQEAVEALTGAPFFRAEAVLAKVSLPSLLARPIQIEDVRFLQPTVTTIQRYDGQVMLPWTAPPSRPPELANQAVKPRGPAPGAPSTKTHPQPTPAPAETPPTPDDSAAAVSSPPADAPPAQAEEQIRVETIALEDGRLRVLSPNGSRSLVDMRGIETRLAADALSSRGNAIPLGSLGIRETLLLDAIRATDAEASVSMLGDGTISLTKIQAEADGGAITGTVKWNPWMTSMPFGIAFDINGVALAATAKRATERLAFSRGGLHASVQAQGYLTTPESWTGKGEMHLSEAALARNGLLESLGRYIGVREFVELAFEEAKSRFEIRGPVLWFEDIHWKTDNLEFKGLGAVGMNQRVRIAARLYFSQRVRAVLQQIERQLPERVIRPFEQVEGREDFYRDFVISGPVQQLRTDFIGSEGRTFEEMLQLIEETRQKEDDNGA